MKLSTEYRDKTKALFKACEDLKDYIFNNPVIDGKKFAALEEAYHLANKEFEGCDKNLRFED